MDETDNPATPPELLVPLTEDAGALTQQRYNWQHQCTAQDCFAALSDPSVNAIVCEVLEDYVVVRSEFVEFVSCKHREHSRGPWRTNDLCSDGGIAHLYDRWCEAPESRARLMTNAALTTGTSESAALRAACQAAAAGEPCADARAEARDALARGLLAARRKRDYANIPLTPKPARGAATEVPDAFGVEVYEFMKRLAIVAELPEKNYMRAHHVETAIPLLLSNAAIRVHNVPAAYDAVVQLVATRNMAPGLAVSYGTWLAAPPSGAAGAELRARVEARTIRRHEILSLCSSHDSRHDSPLLLRRHPSTEHSRLRAKLLAGGIEGTRLNSAQRNREAWLQAWAAYKTGLPGDEGEREDLETRMLDLAGAIQSRCEVANPDAWGSLMYNTLRDEIHDSHTQLAGALPLKAEHLMGVALELASQCEVWFSAEFDVDAAIEQAGSGTEALVGEV